MVVQIGVYDLKHLTSSLLALADNNIMNLDDGSRLRALEKSQKDIIEVISKIRESEPRAGAIDKDTVKHLDKRGYTFYQVRARGKQIKCADYNDFLIELCKVYFPDKDISIREKRQNRSFIPTVRNIGDAWIMEFEKKIDNNVKGLTYGNFHALRGKYNKFIKNSSFASKDIRKITNHDCLLFYQSLTPVDEAGNPLTSESVFDGICTCLNYIFSEAILKNYTVIDVIAVKRAAKATKRISVKPKEPTKIWTWEEWNKIKEECQRRDTEKSRLIEIKGSTFTRSGEAVAFTPDIIDFDEGLIDIFRSMQLQICDDGEARPVLVNHTKGKRVIDETHERLVPFDVNGRIGQILKEQVEKHPDGFLFQNSSGRPFSEKQLCEELQSICKAAGVPYYRPHATRFLGVSILKKYAGMKNDEIKKITGHEHEDMPNYYDKSEELERIIPQSRRKQIIAALNGNGATI